jgi:hypothetical protein
VVIIFGALMYVGLQVAFLGALHPADLENGWAHLSFPEAASPFAGLALAVGAGWLGTLIYLPALPRMAATRRLHHRGGGDGLRHGAARFRRAGVIPFGWDVLVVSVFSIAIYALAISVRLTPEQVRRRVADAREEVDEELAAWR